MEISRLPKYDKYKSSGVKWLGEIPEHWNPLSNKYIFNLKKNPVGKKSGDYVLLSLTLNGVIKRDMENPQGKFPAEFDTYQEVKTGDFIFCMFDVEETPRAVGLSPFDGMITGAYTVMRPIDDFDKGFLYYFYLNLDADKRMKPLYTGLRNTISKENFFSFRTFVPPLPEQTAIANFLDRKTALIDQAIGIKEKQIELLKERRQILIHNAVTRGLNPNVKMKDSCMEWIGEIPEHWEMADLRRFTAEHRQGYYSERGYDENGYKVVRITDLLDNNIVDISDSPFYSIDKENQERYELKKGDFLFQRTGSHKKIGVFSSDEPSIYASYLIRFRFNDKINHKFLLCVLNSPVYTIQLNVQIHGGVNPNIHAENIKICKIVIPSTEEQNDIANFCESITQKINTAIKLKEKEIDKLKEYHTSLINSAVTGKIKVC